MIWLVLGLALFVSVHLVPTAPALREKLQAALSPGGYKGLFSVVSVVALVLIVVGLRSAEFIAIYNPPPWGRSVTLLLMLPALYLFMSNGVRTMPSSAQMFTAHPLTLGLLVWSLAHLLANGDLAHVLLFGTFAVYSVMVILSGKRRGATPRRSTRPPFLHELMFMGVVVLIYATLVVLHPYFTGMPIAV